MSAYRYRAARADGSLESGVIRAERRSAAAALLASRGLFPVELIADAVAADSDTARGRGMAAGDLALGLRMLATLLDAGLPMGRALAAFTDLAPDGWKPALPAIIQAVREGQSLASSLRASAAGVPPLVLGLIEAGEGGSGVAPAVRRAAELSESQAALRSALRSALAYPVLLLIAGAGAVALLTGIVLPRFAIILTDLGQALPPTTRLVLGAAEMARVAALPAVGVAVGLCAAWRAWTARENGLQQWHAILLATPVVGSVRRSAATARACGAAASLLESGVPVASALHYAARAAGDAALSRRILAARADVLHGARVARGLGAHDAATPTVVKLVHAGEESGRLAAMLAHAARLEAERASTAVKAAVRLLEPVLLLAFGGVVALVAAAMLQAVYSVRPTP